MKKIVLSLFLSFIALASVAQSQHIKFLGIPLGQSYTNFNQQLYAKGFKYDGLGGPNMYFFSGTFAGEEVYVNVEVTPKSKKVSTIQVLFKRFRKHSSSSDVRLKYDDILESLKKKYGMPGKSNNDEGFYFTLWDVGDNSIFLGSIAGENFPLCLTYTDKETAKLGKREEETDY